MLPTIFYKPRIVFIETIVETCGILRFGYISYPKIEAVLTLMSKNKNL